MRHTHKIMMRRTGIRMRRIYGMFSTSQRIATIDFPSLDKQPTHRYLFNRLPPCLSFGGATLKNRKSESAGDTVGEIIGTRPLD